VATLFPHFAVLQPGISFVQTLESNPELMQAIQKILSLAPDVRAAVLALIAAVHPSATPAPAPSAVVDTTSVPTP
jgi:hypothetical protein